MATLGGQRRTAPGSGTLIKVDTTINPAGFAIAGIAYTPPVNGKTTLFGIDATGDRLVMIGRPDGVPSPDLGTVTVIGPLGVDTTTDVGFDIAANGAAFASLTTRLGPHQ